MPQDIEKASFDFYSKNHHERHYSHPVITQFAKPKVDWLKSKVNFKGKKVLEVGGGNGYISQFLNPLCDLTVLDISEHELANNPAKTKVCGSAYQLPFEPNSFDIVFCSNLLHHLNFPQKALAEMRRVSKDLVIISEPNIINPLMFFGVWLFPHERGAHRFTKNYLLNLFSQAQLKLLDHTFLGGLVMPNATPNIPFISRPESTSPLSFFQILIGQKN
ncbi:MAG TPA: class I SAM-dependent methyltransferase [Candidatus Woesebacteria bacterium]|nr:class I SAM-dependent methyltransferase [Candidatus Woesebacteria bacterium]